MTVPQARTKARARRGVARVGEQGQLYRLQDNGPGLVLEPERFGGTGDEGWGRAYDSFRRLNNEGLNALNVTLQFESSARGPVLKAHPSSHVGAIPLRSGSSGHVAAGLVVSPRFGWTGIGSVLSHTGWHATPQFLELPLVPGSGREVPPWVLAGPVIARLRALLDALTRGFDFREATLPSPRGTIRWGQYTRESLPTGRWHHVPSRFPDLAADPIVRGAVRWTLERVLLELVSAGGIDRVAADLRAQSSRLLSRVADVAPVYPRPEIFTRLGRLDPLLEASVQSGLQAIGWVRDERGLGGGRQLDGLAWALPLDRLWEEHVAAHVRERARVEGGLVRIGQRGQTLVPLRWSAPMHRSLGSLLPDIVVQRAEAVWIVDAKYKAHLSEIDETGWRHMADDIRNSHRADIHQVLAYSALFDAREITATLAYPLRPQTWQNLKERGLDRTSADVYDGDRHLRVELWGLPFAGAGDPVLRQEEA